MTGPGHLARLDDTWAVWREVGLRSAGFPVDLLRHLASPACAAAADGCLAEEEGATAAGRDRLRAAYRQAFGVALPRVTTALHDLARDDAFREAIVWQNRTALHTGVDVLLEHGAAADRRTSKHRQKEALVVGYVQRYCAKNDTIGFFGPVGWASVASTGPLLDVRPGPDLLASRTTYFEGWCIDTLAAALVAGDASILPWTCPRRLPHVHVEGDQLHLPLAPPVQLPPPHAAVLRACDGVTTAHDLVDRLLATPGTGLRDEAEVMEVLRSLKAARRIEWTLEIPGEGLHPERSLRLALERIRDAAVRARAIADLERLEEARHEVAAAAGQARRLDLALQRLETTFTELTGAAPSRRPGETYAGRALVYEDCRRDVEVRLGPELLATLAPPLALVLDSARWYTHRATELFRDAFADVFERLARRGPTHGVPFATWWLHAYALLFGEDRRPLDRLTAELRQRWEFVLGPGLGDRAAAFRADELRPRVEEAFGVHGRSWPWARHHCPDVLIAAASVEAIVRGQYLLVLGELHPGVHTLTPAFFAAQHPDPEQLFLAARSDLPDQRVVPVFSRGPGGATLRMSRSLVPPDASRFVFAQDACGLPPERALTLAALVMERARGDLEVATRDGRTRFDLLEVLGELVMIRALRAFDLSAPLPHSPRISIDRLVVSRQRWLVSAPELQFVRERDEADRYLAARRWMREKRMPRHVFVRTERAAKPICMDFDSPLSIDVFARAARRALDQSPDAPLSVAEMLPDPDQVWLPDALGRRYSSELRFVAVDRS